MQVSQLSVNSPAIVWLKMASCGVGPKFAIIYAFVCSVTISIHGKASQRSVRIVIVKDNVRYGSRGSLVALLNHLLTVLANIVAHVAVKGVT